MQLIKAKVPEISGMPIPPKCILSMIIDPLLIGHPLQIFKKFKLIEGHTH